MYFWSQRNRASAKLFRKFLQPDIVKNSVRINNFLKCFYLVFRPWLSFIFFILFALLRRRRATSVRFKIINVRKLIFISLLPFLTEHYIIRIFFTVAPYLLNKLSERSHPKLIDHEDEILTTFLNLSCWVDKFLKWLLKMV